MIQIASQKNGETQLSEQFGSLMSQLIEDIVKLNLKDDERVSRDLRVRLLSDLSGDWELHLTATTDSMAAGATPLLK